MIIGEEEPADGPLGAVGEECAFPRGADVGGEGRIVDEMGYKRRLRNSSV